MQLVSKFFSQKIVFLLVISFSLITTDYCLCGNWKRDAKTAVITGGAILVCHTIYTRYPKKINLRTINKKTLNNSSWSRLYVDGDLTVDKLNNSGNVYISVAGDITCKNVHNEGFSTISKKLSTLDYCCRALIPVILTFYFCK